MKYLDWVDSGGSDDILEFIQSSTIELIEEGLYEY